MIPPKYDKFVKGKIEGVLKSGVDMSAIAPVGSLSSLLRNERGPQSDVKQADWSWQVFNPTDWNKLDDVAEGGGEFFTRLFLFMS